MRPTNLQFRSPKEATPGPYAPQVPSYRSSPAGSRKTFGNSKRFVDYEVNAERLGCLVGPGTYQQTNCSISSTHIRGGHVYRPYFMGKNTSSNQLHFVGNHLVQDLPQAFSSKNRPAQTRPRTPDFKSTHKPSYVFVRRNISVVRGAFRG